MEVLATVKLELVRQEGQWETCEGCPATHAPFPTGSLCRYLSNLTTEAAGNGFVCGVGATWRVAPKLTAQQTALVEEVKTPWTRLYIPEGLGK